MRSIYLFLYTKPVSNSDYILPNGTVGIVKRPGRNLDLFQAIVLVSAWTVEHKLYKNFVNTGGVSPPVRPRPVRNSKKRSTTTFIRQYSLLSDLRNISTCLSRHYSSHAGARQERPNLFSPPAQKPSQYRTITPSRLKRGKYNRTVSKLHISRISIWK